MRSSGVWRSRGMSGRMPAWQKKKSPKATECGSASITAVGDVQISHKGAVTWADGTTGLVGTVSASNSLVGTDRLGNGGIVPLANGNFVVSSFSEGRVDLGDGTGGASLGAGCLVLPGVVIGEFALVGAGAVVTRDAPDHGLMVGNPARLAGFVCACGHRLIPADAADAPMPRPDGSPASIRRAFRCSACGMRIDLPLPAEEAADP